MDRLDVASVVEGTCRVQAVEGIIVEAQDLMKEQHWRIQKWWQNVQTKKEQRAQCQKWGVLI